MVYSLNSSKLLKIYKSIYLIRRTELEISKRYKNEQMRCPVHLSIGQEAVPSVLNIFLSKNDLCVSTHRCHAHFIAKGGNLKKMLAEIYGKKTGCSKGRGGSMHLIDKSVGFHGSSAIVGNSIPIGVGLGMSLKLNKSKNISIIYLGDGAIEEGIFFESLNFAVLRKLPCLFVCENNFFSVYSNLAVRQPKKREIYKLAKSIGAKAYKADGNNIYEIFKTFNSAIKFIKNSNGPVFAEFDTYRWLEHCGPNNDDNLGYREKKITKYWLQKDPLKRIQRIMAFKKISKKKIEKINSKINRKINKAFLYAIESPFPSKKDLKKFLYK